MLPDASWRQPRFPYTRPRPGSATNSPSGVTRFRNGIATNLPSAARPSEIGDRETCKNPDVAAQFEVRLANGELEVAESLWGARHLIARRLAFHPDPLNPRSVLPAEISKTGENLFGGRVFVERISTPAELSTVE